MATWQHLRSSTANKRPTTSLADGRIAINTNTASPGLFFKDSAGTGIVKVGPVHVGTTAPNSVPAAGGSSGNYTGEQWLDTSVSPAQMKVWNGSTWVGIVADELPVSKLQDGAARQLIQTDAAGTGVEWTSDVDVPGTLDVTSTATFDSIAQHPLGTAGAPTITFTGDNNTGIYSPGADQVAISTNGTGRLFVDASGRIGVGTSSPAQRLQVGDFSGSNVITVGAGAASSSAIYFSDGNSGTEAYRGYVEYNHGSDALLLGTSGLERLRITSAGLVGVGTSSPVSLLHVYNAGGLATVTIGGDAASSYSQIQLRNSSTKYNWSLSAQNNVDNGFEITPSTAAGGSTFSTPAVVIKSDGKVGVGTTSPLSRLHVEDSGEPVIYIRRDTTSATSLGGPIWRNNSFNVASIITQNVNANSADLTFSTSSGGSLSERLRIDSSGRVGIGTSSPSESIHTTGKLRVGDGGNYTVAAVQLGASNANGISYPGTNILNFITNSTAALTIDASQRVGIGTTSPSAPFVVSASSTAGVEVTAGSAAASSGTLIEHYNRATSAYVQVRTLASVHRFDIGTSEALRIDSSGRLLVGTSTGSYTLEVADNTEANFAVRTYNNGGNNFAGIRLFKSRGTQASPTVVSSGDTLSNIITYGHDGTTWQQASYIRTEVDGTPGANDMPSRLVFSTTRDGQSSPSEACRIDSSQRLLVGRTGPDGSALIQAPATSSIPGYCSATGVATAVTHFEFRNSNGLVGTISTNASATAYNTSSDYRLKENVAPVTDGITRLQRLKPSRFSFIADPTKTVDGFLAHEAAEVVPECVTGEKDAVDDDGNPVYQGIDQSKLVPLLTAALQEAVAEIETLKARLTAAGI